MMHSKTCHRWVLYAIALLLAACSGSGTSSMNVAPTISDAIPQSIRYGSGALLLAVDRESLIPGSIARISGFSAYSSTPVFRFYARVPNAPTSGSLTIGGIQSDNLGHLYLLFDADGYYQQGAIAIYNAVSGAVAQDPNRMIQTSYFAINWNDSYFGGQKRLVVDANYRIYTAAGDVGIIQPGANGIVDPMPLPGWPLSTSEPFSVALDTANNLYVGSSRAFGQSLNEVHKFSPYPNFNAVANFGFSFCASACVATPFISIPYSNEIYVTSARYTELIPPTVLAPTFIAAFDPSAANGSTFYPRPARFISGANTQLGWVHSIAACPNGVIYVSQTASPAWAGAPSGILEFSATSNGNASPTRILAAGDNTITALGF